MAAPPDLALARPEHAADDQLTDFISLWMDKHHVPLPKPGEPEPTLMEEMAIREEAQRAVGPATFRT